MIPNHIHQTFIAKFEPIPSRFCQYSGKFTAIDYIKCLFGYHQFHHFSRKRGNIWASHADGSKSAFCRDCGFIWLKDRV